MLGIHLIDACYTACYDVQGEEGFGIAQQQMDDHFKDYLDKLCERTKGFLTSAETSPLVKLLNAFTNLLSSKRGAARHAMP